LLQIEIAVAMSTYHKGAVQYRVCRFPADADEKAALTEACLDAHVLKQAEVAGAQAPGSAYFFMGNGNDQYYSPPREYAATYTLPAGLSCDGAAAKCVLQMYYVTGEFSRALGRPVGLENVLETNRPTNQPTTHCRSLHQLKFQAIPARRPSSPPATATRRSPSAARPAPGTPRQVRLLP
jgi:hypothetical protein